MKNYKDGWHTVCGCSVWIENNFVIRPYAGGSLYSWCAKQHCFNNILPCTVSRIRYYDRKGMLRRK